MVSSAVKSSIVGTTTSWIDGGNTRYDTNKIILDTFSTFDLGFNKIYIASGENFPDALVSFYLLETMNFKSDRFYKIYIKDNIVYGAKIAGQFFDKEYTSLRSCTE